MDSPLEVKDWSMIVSKFVWLGFPSKNSLWWSSLFLSWSLDFQGLRDGWWFFSRCLNGARTKHFSSAAVTIVLDLLTTADFSQGTNKSPLERHVKTVWKSPNTTTLLTVVRKYPKMSINGTDIKTWHLLCGWQISHIFAPFYSSCRDLRLQDHHHHQHDQNHQYHPQTIPGTGIFTYMWLICMVNVGKYASPIDGMGSI